MYAPILKFLKKQMDCRASYKDQAFRLFSAAVRGDITQVDYWVSIMMRNHNIDQLPDHLDKKQTKVATSSRKQRVFETIDDTIHVPIEAASKMVAKIVKQDVPADLKNFSLKSFTVDTHCYGVNGNIKAASQSCISTNLMEIALLLKDTRLLQYILKFKLPLKPREYDVLMDQALGINISGYNKGPVAGTAACLRQMTERGLCLQEPVIWRNLHIPEDESMLLGHGKPFDLRMPAIYFAVLTSDYAKFSALIEAGARLDLAHGSYKNVSHFIEKVTDATHFYPENNGLAADRKLDKLESMAQIEQALQHHQMAALHPEISQKRARLSP